MSGKSVRIVACVVFLVVSCAVALVGSLGLVTRLSGLLGAFGVFWILVQDARR